MQIGQGDYIKGLQIPSNLNIDPSFDPRRLESRL